MLLAEPVICLLFLSFQNPELLVTFVHWWDRNPVDFLSMQTTICDPFLHVGVCVELSDPGESECGVLLVTRYLMLRSIRVEVSSNLGQDSVNPIDLLNSRSSKLVNVVNDDGAASVMT